MSIWPRRARSASAADEDSRSDWLNDSQRSCQACIRVSQSASVAAERSSAARAASSPGPSSASADLEFGRELGVAAPVHARLLESLRHLREFLSLLAADLARVLDRLLAARDLGADLVVTALHLAQDLALCVVIAPGPFDGRLDRALPGQRRLQGQVALAHDRLARARPPSRPRAA